MTDVARQTLNISMTRRRFVAATAVALPVASLLLDAPAAFAQRKDQVTEVPLDEIAKSGSDLPDLVLGNADAKVTVVEYASMTCGHCAHFANTVFPDFKKKYIDTGKVRYVLREYPLDNLAAAVAMLARCAGGDKTFPLIETFFHTQGDWAFKPGNPVPRLFEIAKQAGFTQEAFDKCLTDQTLLDKITAVRTRASDKFGVSATPTFFINGKKLQGAPTIAEFDKAIEPILAKS